MEIIKEKSQYFNYAFKYEFSYTTLDFCRSLKEKCGWKEINFSDGAWRFNDLRIAQLIRNRYPQVVIAPGIELPTGTSSVESLSASKGTDTADLYIPPEEYTTLIPKGLEEGLRYYQVNALDAVLWALRKGLSGNWLLSLPTGSGKSLIISRLVHILKIPVLIIQPSKEILCQNYEKLSRYVDRSEIGIYSASMNEKTIRTFTFATIQSIYKKAEFFRHFKFVIIDEAHNLNPVDLTGMFSSFLSKMGNPKVLGLSATIYRMGLSYKKNSYGELYAITTTKLINRMKNFFWSRLLYDISVKELIDKGYLCPLEYFDKTLIEHADIPVNKSRSEFDLEKYEDLLTSKQLKIVETVEYAKSISNSVLVFCSSVNQAEVLSSVTPGSAVVSAKTNAYERDRIIKRFKEGKIKTVFNMGVLTCLSDDTEILTSDNNWVGINEINENNKVAQYDNGIITFTKPLVIHKKRLQDNEMIGVNGQYVSILVTKDHDLLIGKTKHGNIKPTEKDFKKLKAEKVINKRWFIPISGYALPKKITVIQDAQPNKRRFLATNSYNYRKKGMSYKESKDIALKMYEKDCKRMYKNPEELTLDECKLIGFWLGDGSGYRSSSGGTVYSLCQSLGTPKMISWIENLLKVNDIHFSFKDYSPKKNVLINGRYCNTKGHRNYVLSKGTGGHNQEVNGLYRLIPYLEKRGSDLFWGLNREQYLSLMEGLWKADGCHGDNKDFFGGRIIGEYKGLFDLLQAIGVCRGFRVTIKAIKKRKFNKKQLYNLSLFDKRVHQLSNDLLKKISYEKDRMIWCVTMPKGTIVTRRCGTVTIMGNCGFDHPSLDCVILLRPTRSIGLYYQMLGRGLRIAPGKKSCKIIDMTSTVKNLGKVETIRLEKIAGKWELLSETENGVESWHNRELFSFMIKPKKPLDKLV